MKYVVIGAGGTGGCIGGYLARSGQDVTLIARGAHLEAMRKQGFLLRSGRIGEITLEVKGCKDPFTKGMIRACEMTEYEGTPDVIFVCVKSYSLRDCIPFINRIAGKETIVIPILNVFGTGKELQKECPVPVILDGCIYIFSMIEAFGVVHQPTSIFRVLFGYRKDQVHQLEEKVKQIETELKAASIDGEYTENILKEALKKFSFVSPMGAAGLYYHATGKDFLVEGEPQTTLFALMREVELLGNAMGITYEEDLIAINQAIMAGLTPDSTTSMQRDVYAKKSSEIDGLVHRMVRLAEEYKITLPTYQMISEWAKKEGIV